MQTSFAPRYRSTTDASSKRGGIANSALESAGGRGTSDLPKAAHSVIQNVYDAASSGDVLGALGAIVAAPAIVLDGFLNGWGVDGGLISAGLGTISTLLQIRDMIADAITSAAATGGLTEVATVPASAAATLAGSTTSEEPAMMNASAQAGLETSGDDGSDAAEPAGDDGEAGTDPTENGGAAVDLADEDSAEEGPSEENTSEEESTDPEDDADVGELDGDAGQDDDSEASDDPAGTDAGDKQSGSDDSDTGSADGGSGGGSGSDGGSGGSE
ncbi:hypothetical protein MPUL_27650 [Mycolicibacterium pulveris]|uniref:Uncharacterized protein n=1 Tax=Mycolicibacterium pulveris TaxID=36813 RepID=A0A7I7UK08_MYCPV|nr:hypothetical protein MPUL_27650 [Mycolicibacterium pulveris]